MKPRFCFPGSLRHPVPLTLSFLLMKLTLYRSPSVQYTLFYLQDLPLVIPHSHVRLSPALPPRHLTLSSSHRRLLFGLSALCST
ncbi:hypothetical protein PVAP13_9NG074096 [Panicum virgatum]|uniref:Uncharacterized protein n=1 Tax=Panicum virgatum TaxID=38727 RepID=A0A8T0MBU4_PANVG|nr:hypothetical protein PVAP13_9NG074096 [Panicum virgatum]